MYILWSLFGATGVPLWWICDRRATVEVLCPLSLWEYGGGSVVIVRSLWSHCVSTEIVLAVKAVPLWRYWGTTVVLEVLQW